MNQDDKNTSDKDKPLVLVAPLDWGLGHTTRMIPVISELLAGGCAVVVACKSTQKIILAAEFPDIRFLEVEGLQVRYGRSRTATMIRLLLLAGNILTKIKREQMWFLRFLAENRIAAVISDNRYGLHAPGVPSILVTHQLRIFSGFGWMADKIVQFFLYRHINAFTECWVPDFRNNNGLAGRLSHPTVLPKTPVTYLGCLSRLQECRGMAATPSTILILLSGPEPQRSLLENKVIAELKTGKWREVTFVRGVSPDAATVQIDYVSVHNYADAMLLNTLVCQSAIVICRAGYTTIMDMVKLKKKMVVIPTPGQAEQEYIANWVSAKRIAPSLSQRRFNITDALAEANAFDYRFPDQDMERYRKVIRNFIASLISS